MSKIIKLKEIREDFLTSLDEIHELCMSDMSSVNNLIIEKMNSNVPLIKEIAKYIVSSGGKRLRPLLTLSCTKMSGYGNKEGENRHIGLAAAIEFIHTATLMHDDVVDKSEQRRGQLSSNEIWGNKTSVLVGDFLFSRAFQLMANDKSEKILRLLSDTSVIISEGEVLELSNENDPTISENIYFQVINGKTASLFGAACQVGGMIANINKSKIEALRTFGINFGMAFQLIDDALDYSSLNKFGKNTGDDFKEGKITLPIILAYLRSNNKEKKFWDRTIKKLDQKKNDFEYAADLIVKYDSIKDTISRAKHFTNIAIDSLGIFDDNQFKKVLIKLVNNSLHRVS